MNIKIKKQNHQEEVIETLPGNSLLEILRQQNLYLPAACGGRGTCGKCKVQMIEGATEPTEKEKKIFSQEEISAGWRLACLAFPEKDSTISLDAHKEEEFQVVSVADLKEGNRQENAAKEETTKSEESEYYIGIDIGTTTIAMALLGGDSGKIHHTAVTVNHQRAFGADVVSRIQASNQGKGQELQNAIQEDLYQGMKKLLRESEIPCEKVKKIAIAGNTTMGHLLMGYSCETLGSYPFTPVNISTITESFQEMFRKQQQEEEPLLLDAQVILLPGISVYVGADIAAGLLSCGFDTLEKPCLFLDLGTNGEMAIGTKEKLLVASVAAGPAFEGGNISCGVGSVPGAISKVTIENNIPTVETIGNAPAIGVCGTGVVETVRELIKAGLVDETGLLVEEYEEKGFPLAKTASGTEIFFTQKDVRELQLAKAAIRAGVETLVKCYEVSYGEIDRVFLAGGFGFKIDLEKTIGIGMLPEEFSGKIIPVGNTSLEGSMVYLTKKTGKEDMEKILSHAKEVELALNADFNEFYMEHMFFQN